MSLVNPTGKLVLERGHRFGNYLRECLMRFLLHLSLRLDTDVNLSDLLTRSACRVWACPEL